MTKLSALLTFFFIFCISDHLLAQPSFFGVSSSPSDNGAQTTATAAVAPPASMVAGDLVIIYAHYRGTGVTLSISTTGGQAWFTGTAPAGGGNQTFAIFWCRYNGTWAANPSVTGGNGTNPLSAIMYVYRPTSSSSLWDIHVAAANSAATNPAVSITGLTTTVPNTVTMAFWASPAANTWGALNGAGWIKTGLANQYRNTANSGQSHTAAYNIRTTAGAVANVSQTQSSSQNTRTSIISWYELAPPANDLCANARLITTDSACVAGTSQLTNQTLTGAASQAYTITSSCSHTNNAADVWYKFVAKTKNPTITVSNPGSGWGGVNNIRIQLLSGSCGAFTEIACGTGPTLTPLLTKPLTEGNTYYIRIHKNISTAIGTNHTFDICVTDLFTKAGRMNEVFSRTVLSGAGNMNNPWEITYGPDDYLWVTDSKNYRVYKFHPNTGAPTTVLDISQNSTFLPVADRSFNCQFNNGAGAQGGLAGLALHPNFLDGTANEKNWVYISYIYSQQSTYYFTNRLVRFTYDPVQNKLTSPVSLCDTLPGSDDHNSQRMIIAPASPGGTPYLFYASGDMGAGQGNNIPRPIKSQVPDSYEGKILRFNLEPDTDAGTWDRWIPNDNPYNTLLGKQSAVWNIGQRNNQGFAYDSSTGILYGTSHGPYSDDELNILQGFKNYGHPLVIGHYSDGNYNGTTTASTNTSISAGAPFTKNSGNSSCPPIGNETTRRNEINAMGFGEYMDPIFSAYPGSTDPSNAQSVKYIWKNAPPNSQWPSEGWSGLDIYTKPNIPGWKGSLVAAGLKWGRLIRLKLGPGGTTTLPSGRSIGNTTDTITYLQSKNRYRDIAFGPNGRDIYIIMDRNAASAATDGNPPVTPACPDCLIKYTFLGYADKGGKSTIPTSIDVTTGTPKVVTAGTPITIDGTNNYLWVPITGPDGNILAEIKANGNNLGVVTSAFYTHTGTVREDGANSLYLDRNLTITPQVQPTSPVDVRLYITQTEFAALSSAKNSKGVVSGVSAIGNLAIFKNDDACGSRIQGPASKITPLYADAHGNGYVLQAKINSFSSFYFGSAGYVALPLKLLSFTGVLQNNATLLQWETANETNTSHFVVERSTDGSSFNSIGTVAAAGNSTGAQKYNYIDHAAAHQSVSTLYYRLKQVDLNGDFTYSKIVIIELKPSAHTVLLYPNPIHDVLKIRVTLSKAEQVQIHVTDMNGRTVHKESRFVGRGTHELEVSSRSWPAQSYLVRITGANNTILTSQNVIKF